MTNPIITIMVGVRGVIHKQSFEALETLKVPKKWTNDLKETYKHIHYTAIKYLTYLILNKRKLNNNQPPIDPP